MKNNLVYLSFKKAIFTGMLTLLVVSLFYWSFDVSLFDSQVVQGDFSKEKINYFSKLLEGGIYSEQHDRFVNEVIFNSFIFSVLFSTVAVMLSLLGAITLYWLLIKSNERIFQLVRLFVLSVNHIPSYILLLGFVAVFGFILNWFPIIYEQDNITTLGFPLFLLSFLFLIHHGFILLQNLTNEKKNQLLYRLQLHRLTAFKQILFLLVLEKRKWWFSIQTILPLMVAGHIYTEVIFGLPGLSRFTYTAIREFDVMLVVSLTGLIAVLYSFLYYISEYANEY